MLGGLRPLMAKLWKAPAKGLLRLGATPNGVTMFGAFGAVASALWFVPRGQILAAVIAITAFAFTDMLDGTMARLSGKTSRFGAFLDSTLDRVVDAAIFGTLAWYYFDIDRLTATAALLALILGSFVPYARARAEGLGIEAKAGIAERSDRLVAIGILGIAIGVGAPQAVMTYGLFALALAAAITVVQRSLQVAKASREDPALPPAGE